ncbi:hypothetical protein [Ideonella sp. BN130291]|uniref:hypothetical protein n=1 Tax=Ideonella sp. BN130291 TaxID=3112940 RepID=UPI002E26903F|nr:hypothetical protein [Ideonella sp. BN130291]
MDMIFLQRAFLSITLLVPSCYAATPLPDGSALAISLSTTGTVSVALSADRPRAVSVGAELNRAWSSASELLVVGQRGISVQGRAFVVVAIATPSTKRHGGGHCGAGTEDKLLLLEWQAAVRRLQLRDTLLMQSCLTALSLVGDQAANVKDSLGKISDPTRLTLQWLSHPRHGAMPKTVTVRNGRFHLS